MSNFSSEFCAFVTFSHVMEPAYPGVVGHYVNLGEFYDRKNLRPFAEDFINIKKRYQACYSRAYQCIRAAKEVRRNGEKEIVTENVIDKVVKRARGILSREIKRKKGTEHGKETKRFLGGITCQGLLCLYETVQTQCKRIYELQDNCGISSLMLEELKDGIIKAGYDVTLFLSPEDPTRLEHMVIPELSLAFVTTTMKELEKRPYRRIRMESMVEKEALKKNRAKLRFANRIANELLEDGIRELKQAKAMHDEMEAIFHSFVDFAGINQVTKKLIEEIENLP